MKALVLSGGGSKGSYQIGVWKALKKLNIKFDIVTGTSAGAINGALITQNSYFKAIKIWKNLNFNNIFGDNFKIDSNEKEVLNLYKTFTKNFISNGGTDVEELQNLINKTLNKKKFYASKINYGLVTFNLSTKKPLLIEKKDIPEDKLGDYILASASCFPAFKRKTIDGEDYIDGGYYDNIPVNLAIDMGADEVIIVDLNAIGMKHRSKKKIKQTVIKPNNSLSNFLIFDPKRAEKNMKYGYNDTLKAFKKLEGKKYSFKKGEYNKFIIKYKTSFTHTLFNIFDSNELINSLKSKIKVNENLTDIMKYQFFIRIMDNIGTKLDIDDTKIYTLSSFNKAINKKIKYIKKCNSKNNILNLYNLIKEKDYVILKKECIKKPIDLLDAIYLYIVNEGKYE